MKKNMLAMAVAIVLFAASCTGTAKNEHGHQHDDGTAHDDNHDHDSLTADTVPQEVFKADSVAY